MFTKSDNLKSPNVNSGFRGRIVLIALLLALTLGNAGQPALAQRSEPKILSSRLSTTNVKQICLYDIVEVQVRVVRAVEFSSGKASPFVRPGIGITARVEDPTVVELLGESEIAQLDGSTSFRFRGDKEGTTTLIFNAEVTLARGEVGIGATLVEPNKLETRVFVEVKECKFEVTAIGEWFSESDGAFYSITAVADEAVISPEGEGGLYTGSASVTWSSFGQTGTGCPISVQIASGQVRYSGEVNESQLQLDQTYAPVEASDNYDCGNESGFAQGLASADPLTISMPASGGVSTLPNNLTLDWWVPSPGSVTVVVIPVEDEATAVNVDTQTAISPWIFAGSVGLVLTRAFKKKGKKSNNSKRWVSVLLSLVPLLLLSACGAGDGATADSQEVDVVFGPGDFIFPDTNAGLADLSSYKATLTLTFDGTRAGQAELWSRTYVMLSIKEPAERHLTIQTAGDLSDLDPVFFSEVDGAAYEHRGGSACSATVIDLENSQIDRLQPAGLLTGVIGAEEAGSETVNDMATTHYTFDERAFGQEGLAESTGEMWVASEGGYIVRYLVTTQGDATYFGEGIEGTLTWDYELTDVNVPAGIDLPADCPAGMVDAPMMADASNVLNMPSVLAYDTSSNLADASAFYQEQLPGLGWTHLGEPSIEETTAHLLFTKGDQQMTVIISAGDGTTTIHILIAGAQE